MECSPTKKITIAIDGYSSCGKSTFAKRIAAELGYIFIDTGAMYRAVTLYGLQHGAIHNGVIDAEALERMLPSIQITFCRDTQHGTSNVCLNGIEVEQSIRSLEVSDAVSRVSQIATVRQQLVRQQQQMGLHKGIVMDGRDIGTVVFPEAELKIFMTADPEVRALRRYNELQQKGDTTPLDQIRRNLTERDQADLNRTVSPLRQAQDAIVLDNSHMTIDQQMEWVMDRIRTLTAEKC